MTASVVTRVYQAGQVCRLANVTYRQLDYWTRTGRLEASRRPARGTGGGNERLYTRDDVLRAALLSQLLAAGLQLDAACIAAGALLAQPGATAVRLADCVHMVVDLDALRIRIDRRDA